MKIEYHCSLISYSAHIRELILRRLFIKSKYLYNKPDNTWTPPQILFWVCESWMILICLKNVTFEIHVEIHDLMTKFLRIIQETLKIVALIRKSPRSNPCDQSKIADERVGVLQIFFSVWTFTQESNNNKINLPQAGPALQGCTVNVP